MTINALNALRGYSIQSNPVQWASNENEFALGTLHEEKYFMKFLPDAYVLQFLYAEESEK